jgi:hypothetical protein
LLLGFHRQFYSRLSQFKSTKTMKNSQRQADTFWKE